MSAEFSDRVDVRLLRRQREVADRHVFDHALAKRARRSHRGPPVLRGVDVTITSSQTGGFIAAIFLLLRRSRFVQYGLAAGVISDAVDRAQSVGDRPSVGQLHINDQTVNGGPFAPFGGRKRSGNGSRVSGPAIWEEFTQWVWVSVKSKATAYPF